MLASSLSNSVLTNGYRYPRVLEVSDPLPRSRGSPPLMPRWALGLSVGFHIGQWHSMRVSHSPLSYPDVFVVSPLSRTPDIAIRPPGSKSITNRALMCAALASGTSTLRGVLFAEDTRAMLDSIAELGATVGIDEAAGTVTIQVNSVQLSSIEAQVDARQSGTTSRFILPAVALSSGRSRVGGSEQLLNRPFGPLFDALRRLGASVDEVDVPGHLPVLVRGPLVGGSVELPGHLSSQFISGLMMAAPLMRDGLHIQLISPVVSEPYIRMTAAVMGSFGVEVRSSDIAEQVIAPARYSPCDYAVEPDASAASYFMAAAAISGGRVTIEGLGTDSIQGDVLFADVLERMGAVVERSASCLTVIGPRRLRGLDVDMGNISDTAQTLAAVAVFAETPTRVRGIGFIRGKETDRIHAIVTELKRAGIKAVEHEDGFTIEPGEPAPARFATYDDHRMAMSLSLLGLRVSGVEIDNPGCVAKTYPTFFEDLRRLG